jgi:hypothetical protein
MGEAQVGDLIGATQTLARAQAEAPTCQLFFANPRRDSREVSGPVSPRKSIWRRRKSNELERIHDCYAPLWFEKCGFSYSVFTITVTWRETAMCMRSLTERMRRELIFGIHQCENAVTEKPRAVQSGVPSTRSLRAGVELLRGTPIVNPL